MGNSVNEKIRKPHSGSKNSAGIICFLFQLLRDSHNFKLSLKNVQLGGDFCTLTDLYNHYSNFRTFSTPQINLILTSRHSPSLTTRNPSEPLMCILSLKICHLWTCCVKGIIQNVVLCDWLFSQSQCFQGSSILQCLSVPHFFIAK